MAPARLCFPSGCRARDNLEQALPLPPSRRAHREGQSAVGTRFSVDVEVPGRLDRLAAHGSAGSRWPIAAEPHGQAQGLTGVGGWARGLLRDGAAVFVGTHWEATDDLAPTFARPLRAPDRWGCDRSGGADGAAGRPPSRSWLAYTVFADPAAALPVDGRPRPRAPLGCGDAAAVARPRHAPDRAGDGGRRRGAGHALGWSSRAGSTTSSASPRLVRDPPARRAAAAAHGPGPRRTDRYGVRAPLPAVVAASPNIYLRNMIRQRRYPGLQGVFLDRRLTAAERRHMVVRADLGRDADVLAVASGHPACASGVSRAMARGIAKGTIRTNWSAAGVPTPAGGDAIALRRAGDGFERSSEPRFGAGYLAPKSARITRDGGLSEAASGNQAIAAVTSWSRARSYGYSDVRRPGGRGGARLRLGSRAHAPRRLPDFVRDDEAPLHETEPAGPSDHDGVREVRGRPAWNLGVPRARDAAREGHVGARAGSAARARAAAGTRAHASARARVPARVSRPNAAGSRAGRRRRRSCRAPAAPRTASAPAGQARPGPGADRVEHASP